MKRLKSMQKKKGMTLLLCLFVTSVAFGQSHPGADPSGGSIGGGAPLDSSTLMAILGGAGVLISVIKSKREKND